MARLRSNEWNFSSNAAARITEILHGDDFIQSPLGHAEAELTEFMGNHRLDLVIFARANPATPVITGELKAPWDALGRTPYNSRVLEDAHRKASNCGSQYFITWNIRRAVVWRTDDPGVPLPHRVVHDAELIPFTLTSAADLSRPDFQVAWKKALEDFVGLLHQLFVGSPQPNYVPLDRQFIGRLESLLDFPIELTTLALADRMGTNARFRRGAESWMRDRQGWLITTSTMQENVNRASRFTCYVLVNRLCFYNALCRKYSNLERLNIHSSIKTGETLKAKLAEAFGRAMRFTGDYDTVFETDAGDDFPFLSDEAVPEWRTLIKALDSYDFATIDLEIIGAMYEQLLSPEERYRYGQHYTQPAVVDLINAFSIHDGKAEVLDPACGGGTFLVRAYARKKCLDANQDHTTLLSSLYGCDLQRYACHLSTINLAVRDLIDDENCPRIHCGDFLDVNRHSLFAELPTRLHAGGLPTGTRRLQLSAEMFDAVVGNPPYIQARQIPAGRRATYLNLMRQEWPNYKWDTGSDILVWFFLHGASFLRPDGCLSLLTQAAYLDGEYGIPLRQWMMDHFRVVAVLETEAEPWFSDARVATVVTVLAREQDDARRQENPVRFVQFRAPLDRPKGGEPESARRQSVESLRDSILSHEADAEEGRYRVRVIRQGELYQLGLDGAGNYVGTKWGRYLRAIDTLYRLVRDHGDGFCELGALADVARGVTTNCDDFFIVTDVSREALAAHPAPKKFQTAYCVTRADVEADVYKIVRRDDGVEFALESARLIPTLKTARDVNERRTSAIGSNSFAVHITGPREELSAVTEAYIAAGEREHWHESASFNGRPDWYVLREALTAPILFVKTIQYAPQIIWNDAGLLANQRLYNVSPRRGVNAEVLGAVLNSTVFAAERFAGVKALGREAANDVEVFTARQFKVPEIRKFSDADREDLTQAFRRIRESPVGPLVEARLMNAGLSEARVYAEQHPVGAAVWPDELRNPDRQKIDAVILRRLGFSPKEAEEFRARLYDELVAFTRKSRLLELEAQIDRRGRGGNGPTPAQMADDLWADLTADNQAQVRTLPTDFIKAGTETAILNLPATGRPVVDGGDLFSRAGVYEIRFGYNSVRCDSAGQRDLCLLLVANRVRGQVVVPKKAGQCRAVAEAIRAYVDDLMPKLRAGAAEITENADLQQRIIKEATKRLLPHRR